ncbi:RNA-binding protein 25 [Pistacia vera]|uniref:RNA-binding protein 25 n=1 Tax=Pistacia vera TaxID=55513 RepID=UPI001262B2F8|nr:RNA-binding protein 25 [Pistacia vera]
MDSQHRNNSTSTTTTPTSTSELFICFTSRLSSSSSMKITSKSILSPGRARDSSQISLSTSLSRRLRNSGSIKGGQASPMFPASNGKKRGCSFENPEPSSPKVTCIGQVRVKTKKQGKKIRARSKSRREVSFRKPDQTGSINSSTCNGGHNVDGGHFQDFGGHGQMSHSHSFQQQECLPHRNQRWVHLPMTICEALRTFGAEFNCFLPCRSSCMAREKVEKARSDNGSGSGSTSSCGAVFARWLVAEKIELVVGEEEDHHHHHHHHRHHEDDDEEEDDMPRRSQRRHVFEDIVIEDAKFEDKNEILEEEEARVSVPPKNALLLMRCRSDPVKMAALANRFWECPPQDEAEDEENEDNKDNKGEKETQQDGDKDCRVKVEEEVMEQRKEVLACESLVSVEVIEEDQMIQNQIPDAEAVKEADLVLDREEEEQESEEICEVEGDLQRQEEEEEEKQVLPQPVIILEEEESVEIADPEKEENANAELLQENEHVLVEYEAEPALEEDEIKHEFFDAIEESRPRLSCSSVASVQPQRLSCSSVASLHTQPEQEEAEELEEKEPLEKILLEEEEEEEESVKTSEDIAEPEDPEITQEPETGQESKEKGGQKQQNLLPDCLLLMMCEPKLSMEVSKETWVCSTDFIRWDRKPPIQPVNKTDGCDELKRRISIDSKPPQLHNINQQLMQPPRSSCSFPAAPPLPPTHGAASMNSQIEQKLAGAKQPYEPFVLTRCKSEPMRSSAKFAPEACFWKNRKLEPHRPGTVGVGAAGVGF